MPPAEFHFGVESEQLRRGSRHFILMAAPFRLQSRPCPRQFRLAPLHRRPFRRPLPVPAPLPVVPQSQQAIALDQILLVGIRYFLA